jgi:hypothetical protein
MQVRRIEEQAVLRRDARGDQIQGRLSRVGHLAFAAHFV